MTNANATAVADMAFQNRKLARLAKDQYTLASLQAVIDCLRANGTLRLHRYMSGGCSAVSPLDDFCRDKALDGLLINHWDRDSILQAFGELLADSDRDFFGDLGIKPQQWKKGVLASLKHHHKYAWRFGKVIEDKVSKDDRPHIRYNPAGLFDLADPWGHAQNDSLSAVLWGTFYLLNRGLLNYNNAEVKELVNCFAVMLHCLMWKLEVWQDTGDHGAWEDMKAEHTSSIEVVVAALREQLTWLDKNGGRLTWHAKWADFGVDRDYDVTSKGTQELIDKCVGKLRQVLPKEFVRTAHGDATRNADVAQVNGLFLAAASGGSLLDDEMTLTLIDNIEKELMGHIGIGRYAGDTWDGRENPPNKPIAQWCHPSPMISFIFGEMFRRTGKQEYFVRQKWHFNRALAQVNPRWHVPEAYIEGKNGRWISDENESLAWAQAMTICAFAGMKASLVYQEAQKPVEAAATTSGAQN